MRSAEHENVATLSKIALNSNYDKNKVLVKSDFIIYLNHNDDIYNTAPISTR